MLDEKDVVVVEPDFKTDFRTQQEQKQEEQQDKKVEQLLDIPTNKLKPNSFFANQQASMASSFALYEYATSTSNLEKIRAIIHKMRVSDDPFAVLNAETSSSDDDEQTSRAHMFRKEIIIPSKQQMENDELFLTLLKQKTVQDMLIQFLKDTAIFASVETCMTYQWPIVLERLVALNTKTWIFVVINPQHDYIFRNVLHPNHMHLWSALFIYYVRNFSSVLAKYSSREYGTTQWRMYCLPLTSGALQEWLVYPDNVKRWLIESEYVTHDSYAWFVNKFGIGTKKNVNWKMLQDYFCDDDFPLKCLKN
jgi:hypothetical protein